MSDFLIFSCLFFNVSVSSFFIFIFLSVIRGDRLSLVFVFEAPKPILSFRERGEAHVAWVGLRGWWGRRLRARVRVRVVCGGAWGLRARGSVTGVRSRARVCRRSLGTFHGPRCLDHARTSRREGTRVGGDPRGRRRTRGWVKGRGWDRVHRGRTGAAAGTRRGRRRGTPF